MKAVVLCGGLGTRLRPLTDDTPKPLIPVAGKPLLAYQLEALAKAGVGHVYVNLLQFPQKIINFIGDGSAWGLTVTYAVEPQPLGTAGALRLFRDALTEPFLVIYSDVLGTFPYIDLYQYHREKKAQVTMVVRHSDHPKDSDLAVINKSGRVIQLLAKPHEKIPRKALGVAACYCMDPSVLSMLPVFSPADIFCDFLPHLARNRLTIQAYKTNSYTKDVGTKERLHTIERDIVQGRVVFP